MAFLQIPRVRISGMAGIVPDCIFDNMDYDWISEKEREILINTTGIKERRFSKKGVCASDLGVCVTEKLIVELGWEKSEIELLIFVSQSRDYILPNTACMIQDRLGLKKNCMAFDIPLGCSGYVYGLSVASSIMMNGCIKKGLIISGDVSSYYLAYQDKSAFPLFGDAVTVTSLEFTGNGSDIMEFMLHTDGSGYDSIIVPDGGYRNGMTVDTLTPVKYEEKIIRNNKDIFLDGMKVFEFSIKEVAKNIKSLLNELQKGTDDYDFFVFHQANLLMNETIRKQLKLDIKKVPYTLSKFGNTSSASIPLTIISELREFVTSRQNNIIISGFGVGLSWGAAAINLDNIVCPEIYEYHAE